LLQFLTADEKMRASIRWMEISRFGSRAIGDIHEMTSGKLKLILCHTDVKIERRLQWTYNSCSDSTPVFSLDSLISIFKRAIPYHFPNQYNINKTIPQNLPSSIPSALSNSPHLGFTIPRTTIRQSKSPSGNTDNTGNLETFKTTLQTLRLFSLCRVPLLLTIRTQFSIASTLDHGHPSLATGSNIFVAAVAPPNPSPLLRGSFLLSTKEGTRL
jgi:hypothetical protein